MTNRVQPTDSRARPAGSGHLRDPTAPGLLGWCVWGLAALFFCYGFFHRVSPSVMIDHLMRDFQVGGALLGNLSATYFYIYAALQIPVGLMVDRWGPRAILTFGALLCSLGAVTFALSPVAEPLYLGRFMIGAGAGFGFVSALTLAARWFPARRFAFLVGGTMTLGMAGGFLGQAPLAAAVDLFGWRQTLVVAGVAGGVLTLAIWLVVRDRPAPLAADAVPAPDTQGKAPLLQSFAAVMARPRNWALALVGAAMTAPLLSFAGLWGVAWLMQVGGLSRPEAAATTSLLLIGWAVGSPLAGAASDRLGRRRWPLITAATAALACLAALLYLPGLEGLARAVLFFMTGFFCGAMAICFALAREDNPPEIAAVALAFVNTAVVASGALFQPLIGAALDWRWDGRLVEGVRIYSAEAYSTAFSLLIGFLVLGIIASFAARETRCQPFSEGPRH